MRELAELLSGRAREMPLDAAALRLARIEFPDLNPAPYLKMLDDLAGALARRTRGLPGRRYIEEANRLLFEEQGFRGNEDDYYNPHNSCLNDVLSQRIGIPITLSIVYIEISRRLGRTVHGIGLPGHFLVQYQDPEFSAFLDPFHEGRLLAPGECLELASRITGKDLPQDPALLRPVSCREIVIRMLSNLRPIYFERRNWPKLKSVLDLLIAAIPESAEERKQRAVVHLQLRQFTKARDDFEQYLRMAPDAADRRAVIEHITAIGEWIAGMN